MHHCDLVLVVTHFQDAIDRLPFTNTVNSVFSRFNSQPVLEPYCMQ